jgi:hypothetical protein
MEDDFEVNATSWIMDKGTVVTWMIMRSKSRGTIADATGFESCGMELADLLGV